MFPNRNNNNMPPNPMAPHIPKDIINDLCDRIKSEYSLVYAYIQNLKNELDKANSNRISVERLQAMNHDMSCFFSSEIHKMMDYLKRLLNACQQQMAYVPFEFQGNFIGLIEQVKAYTNSDPTVPIMHHLSAINNQANMIHPEPLPYNFHHSMPGYMPRPPLPLPSPIESRDIREFPPIEPYRYPIKDVSAMNTDSGTSLNNKDKNLPRQNGSNEVSLTPPSAKAYQSDNNVSGDSPKMAPDSDEKETKDTKYKEQENEENRPRETNSKDANDSKNSNASLKRAHNPETPRVGTSPKRVNIDSLPTPQHKIHRPDSHGNPKHLNSAHKNGSYPFYPMPYPEAPVHMAPPHLVRHPMNPHFEPRVHHPPNPYNHVAPYPPYPHHHQFHSPGPLNENDLAKKVNIPSSLNSFGILEHGDVVCAASFSRPYNYVFTGSKGVVKIWDVCDVSRPKHLSSVDCLKDNYVRACKSINQNKTLIVCGEYPSVGVWNLNQTSNGLMINSVADLSNPAPVCYNMAITPDERQIYCCCNNGNITAWDLETTKIIRSFTGHVDGATSIDIARDGTCVWTGGLDATARCWDIRDGKQMNTFSFSSQVFSLCASPLGDYIVVGLENKTIELCYCSDGNRLGERNIFKVHDSCVLTVKISNSGHWLISSSKDNYTNCVQIPVGRPLFITRDTASILCADISPDDRYIITGAGDKKATIYECMY